jgi:hypothetical protein
MVEELRIMNKEDLNNVVKELKVINETLDVMLPAVVPEVEQLFDKIGPVFDKFLGAMYKGKNFDRLIILGMTQQLLREHVQVAGLPSSVEEEQAVANRAVQLANTAVTMTHSL